MKEILYILLDNYAEHEIGFLPGAVSTDAIGFRKEPKYINKMVASTMEPVKSIGGMRTLPTFADVDKEYQHALTNGAASVLSPTTEPWGQRTCYVADPDGNLIEIGTFTK